LLYLENGCYEARCGIRLDAIDTDRQRDRQRIVTAEGGTALDRTRYGRLTKNMRRRCKCNSDIKQAIVFRASSPRPRWHEDTNMTEVTTIRSDRVSARASVQFGQCDFVQQYCVLQINPAIQGASK
jgi:hypothetical protein